MNILIIGKGGREHALARKFLTDNRVENVYVYPGNDGMNLFDQKISVFPETPWADFLNILSTINIEICIMGSESDILSSKVEDLKKLNIYVVAPSHEASKLESSKIFSKNILNKANIKTALSVEVHSYDQAYSKALEVFQNKPFVIKLSGLHAGKGVYVAKDFESGMEQLKLWKNELESGALLEELLIGHEVSMFYLCHEESFCFLGEACDYKRLLDENQGPNTGGMGSYSPDLSLTDSDRLEVVEKIIKPTLFEMKKANTPFIGVLFAGLMKTQNGIYVIEYNVRFGDPETQSLLPRIDSGFLDAFLILKNDPDQLSKHQLTFSRNSSLYVVKAHPNYPHNTDEEIELIISKPDHLFIFSGVSKKNNRYFTQGGRVLGRVEIDESLTKARENCYQKLPNVSFLNEHYRKDIGIIYGA